MKLHKKVLYFERFIYPIAYTGELREDYIRVTMFFDFKDGLRFSVSTENYSCCERNIFKAFLKVVEIGCVGYNKYQTLKDDCRDKGFWKLL